MADKFIRHGATFNGDGTSSALATVDGGVGAWNNINILEGTEPAYGVLAAGDTVFIRSKDESGVDIVRTLAATVTLGMAGLTGPAQCVTWVLDNGAVWSDATGVLTYSCPSSYVVNLGPYNKLIARTEDAWRVVEANASANDKFYLLNAYGVTLENIKFDFSAATLSYGSRFYFQGYAVATFKNCAFRVGRHGGGFGFIYANYSAVLRFINPRIEFTVVDNVAAVFHTASPVRVEVIGGYVTGDGATGKAIVSSTGPEAHYLILGLKYPNTMRLYDREDTSVGSSHVDAIGTDGEVCGAMGNSFGYATSRRDNYYPTLNAHLPDSIGRAWSWCVFPRASNKAHPFEIASSSVYTAAAAAKTLDVEFLVSNTLAGVNKATLYVLFTYTDNITGLPKYLSTQDFAAGALPSSTANWSATTYGPVLLTKHKLSVTTPTSIKQDTLITATLVCEVGAAGNANSTIILCPEIVVT